MRNVNGDPVQSRLPRIASKSETRAQEGTKSYITHSGCVNSFLVHAKVCLQVFYDMQCVRDLQTVGQISCGCDDAALTSFTPCYSRRAQFFQHSGSLK